MPCSTTASGCAAGRTARSSSRRAPRSSSTLSRSMSSHRSSSTVTFYCKWQRCSQANHRFNQVANLGQHIRHSHLNYQLPPIEGAPELMTASRVTRHMHCTNLSLSLSLSLSRSCYDNANSYPCCLLLLLLGLVIQQSSPQYVSGPDAPAVISAHTTSFARTSTTSTWPRRRTLRTQPPTRSATHVAGVTARTSRARVATSSCTSDTCIPTNVDTSAPSAITAS